MNGEKKAAGSGEQDFSATQNFTEGDVRFAWCYAKDHGTDSFEDAGWLRKFRFIQVASSIETSLSGAGREASVEIVSRIAVSGSGDRLFDATLDLNLSGDLVLGSEGSTLTSTQYDFSYAGGTSDTFVVRVPVYFVSERGGMLELTLSGDAIEPISERIRLSPPELRLELQAPAQVGHTEPDEDFEVRISARAPGAAPFGGTIDVSLTAELSGGAIFAVDSTIVSVETIQLSEEFTAHTLRVRLNSVGAISTLRLALAVGGIATSATTLLLPVRSLRSLRIAAPMSLDLPLPGGGDEVRNVEMSLQALDNFGAPWSRDVTATLTAALSGTAVFVDGTGAAAGNMLTSPISITAGEATHTLRVRLNSSAESSTLRLTLVAGGIVTSATTLLLPARSLHSLRIATPMSLDLLSGKVGNVEMSLQAFDNYGAPWSGDVTATLTAELDSAAIFVGAADGETITTSVLSISAGQTTTSLRLRLISNSDARLLLTLAADGVVTTATVSLRAVPPLILSSLSIGTPLDAMPSPPAPFEALTATLELRLFDQFGRALRLDLTEEESIMAAFPLQIRLSVAKDLPLEWTPRTVTFSQISPDALFHTINLSVESLATNDGEPLQIVVETAASASTAHASNVVSLPLGDFQQYRQAFCSAVGLNDAGCALVEDIYASGSSAWLPARHGAGLVSGAVGDQERSCLHVRLNFDEPRTLETRMRVSSEETRDLLIFRLNDASPSPDRSVRGTDDFLDTGNDSDGRPTVFLGRSGVENFMHRQRLPAGESEVSWCYDKDLIVGLQDDAGYLLGLRFLKLGLALDVPEELTLMDAPREH